MPLESGAVWRQGQCLGLLIGILELFLNSCSGLVGAVLGEVTSVWEYHYMGRGEVAWYKKLYIS